MLSAGAYLTVSCLFGFEAICHSCWLKSRMKEVASDLTVNQAEISRVLDMVKAIADSDVFIEEHE